MKKKYSLGVLSAAIFIVGGYSIFKDKPTMEHTSAVLVADLKSDKTVNRFRSCLEDYKVNTKNPVTREGLAELRASASGAFSLEFIKSLKTNVPSNDIIIVDLRAEKHGMLNGQPISWYAPQNHEEGHQYLSHKELVDSLNHTTPVVLTHIKSKVGGLIHTHEEELITSVEAMTEEDLVTSQGLRYINIPVRDHHTPDDLAVETFVELFQGKSKDTWLHMHCRAGKGRATTFMVMLDILQNGDHLSLEQILERQHLLGKKDLLSIGDPGTYKYKLMTKRIKFLKQFYAYTKDSKGVNYQKWSDWKQTA